MSRAAAATTRIEVALLLGLLAIYLLTMPLALRTVRRLQTQSARLDAHAAALREALAGANAASEGKDRFPEAISHELRTPLQSILGPVEILRARGESMSPERRGELLRMMHENASRLTRILVDLVDLDRLRHGILTARRSDVDVRELVERSVRPHRSDGHHIHVSVDLAEARVDGSMLERVIENLVLNAKRHTPWGTRIELTVTDHRGGLAVIVDDDGPGIAEPVRERIFEPFERGDNPSHSPGTGVGSPWSGPSLGSTGETPTSARRRSAERASPSPSRVHPSPSETRRRWR